VKKSTPRLFSCIRALFRRGRIEDDLSEELHFHLEREIAKNVKVGMTSEDARYAALRTFGGVDQAKEELGSRSSSCSLNPRSSSFSR